MKNVLSNGRFFFGVSRRLISGIFLIAGVLCWAAPGQTWAAVFAVGDVTPQQTFTDIVIGGQMVDITAPNLPSGGGRVTNDGTPTGTDADLVVGGTGELSGNLTFNILTTIGSVTINNPTGTLPLIAPNVNIGMLRNGVGRINLNDFGTTLVAETLLTIGDEGEGELRLTNGARVGVGIFNTDPMELKYENGTTVIGSQRNTSGADQFLSEGIVVIDGFGSVLETENLTVADEGLGTLEISGKGRLLTTDATLGETGGSTGRVTLTGLGTRWNNLDDLIVGNDGNGLLEVNDFAVVVSDTITVGTTSFIDLDGGTLVTNSSLSSSIANNGVIRGAGRIESGINISSSGQLRNAASGASLREYLLVTGEVTNGGTIESLGGEMEFQAAVTNNFEIVARDAVMRFNDGLTNTGSLTLGGDTTLHGMVNNSGGQLTVLSDSSPLLVGDLQFTSGILALSIGGEPGIFDITGSADLSGAVFDLNYLGAAAPQSGDVYQLLQAGGGISGTFPTSASDGTNIWDITNPGGGSALFATFNGVGANPMGADFNGDGVVDGLDMATWKANFPIASGATIDLGDADGDGDVDSFDFLKIQRDFGVIPVPPLAAATGAVPEPSSIALLMLGGVLAMGRRSRRVR